MVLIIVLALLFLILFATGGLMAIQGGQANTIVLVIHKISAIVTVIITAIIIYLLVKGR